MIVAELVTDRESKGRAPDRLTEVIQRAFQKGLLLLICGENTIRFCPALTVSMEEIDT